MGHGNYSAVRATATSADYDYMDRQEIFQSIKIQNKMDPKDTIRECCDSKDHPNTIPIIIALDVTGSMGHVPELFIRNEMTKIMDALYQGGLKDSQILFMGIGDHECDRAPLQVGQFESDDQLLDKWLKNIYLEGGGGGNDGESYLLAWKYAAENTSLDSLKRGKRGFLFTIGDEKTLTNLHVNAQQNIFGNGQHKPETAQSLLTQVSSKYHVKHLHLTETYQGSRKENQIHWQQIMGEDCMILKDHSLIADTIISVIKENSGKDEVIADLKITSESEHGETVEEVLEEVIEEML